MGGRDGRRRVALSTPLRRTEITVRKQRAKKGRHEDPLLLLAPQTTSLTTAGHERMVESAKRARARARAGGWLCAGRVRERATEAMLQVDPVARSTAQLAHPLRMRVEASIPPPFRRTAVTRTHAPPTRGSKYKWV